MKWIKISLFRQTNELQQHYFIRSIILLFILQAFIHTMQCLSRCALTAYPAEPLALVFNPFLCVCVLFCSQVCLFLKRGASQTEVDEQGHDPLSIAVQAANADIVTL